MLVIPPGLSEEEEALQKKFNKLKKKVRGWECGGRATPPFAVILRTWEWRVRMLKGDGSPLVVSKVGLIFPNLRVFVYLVA